MKVSIITVCFNSEKTIEDTILSVVSQSYANIEYIILDGISSDSTLEIVEKYRANIAVVISEKDGGMYDALNKGIDLATGEVIAILNSDDVYKDKHVIQEVVDSLIANNSDACYGDLVYVDKNNLNLVSRYWKAKAYKENYFIKGWMPPHPSFFVKKTCYETYGKFNLGLVSAADYELMLRFIHKHHIKLSYVPRVLVKMREGGLSNISLFNRLRGNKEDHLAWKINSLKPSFLTLSMKPLRKILQFIPTKKRID
ncbi:MAG: glycosyltransferase [Bacteroidetes bacterium]|nr:MAG: glycosyltransferase [Bacteroidota bacterium]MBL1145621.1 glycosyltransferase [Bacteroidota bacterium]NOG58417.1 glycosyltransferase [Bacteroidota bacterium]